MHIHDFLAQTQASAESAVAELDVPSRTYVQTMLATRGNLPWLWAELIVQIANIWEVPDAAVIRLAVATRFLMTAADAFDDVIDAEVAPPAIPITVNTSIALWALAYRTFLSVPYPLSTLRLFNQAILDAANGEQMDIDSMNPGLAAATSALNACPTEETYVTQARFKSGVPLAALCVSIAEQSGTLTEAERAGLHLFGLSLGIAYQIHNDLGALAPEASTKRDLAQNRLSLPLIFLRDKVSNEEYSQTLQLACAGEQAARVQFSALLESSGASAYARVLAQVFVNQAQTALQSTPRGTALLHIGLANLLNRLNTD